MKRLALLLGLALAGLLALAGPAAAHVTVSSTDATPGGDGVVTLHVPTESDTASTTKVEVELPPVGSFSVLPTPGWTFAATKTTVTWTATAGGTKPGEFQQFVLSIEQLPKAASVTFPTIQTYSDGTVAKWIEQAAPGSSAEPEHPAPTLSLRAAADPSAPAKVEKASTTGPTVLSIVALVVAAAALGLALVSRAKASS